MWGDLVLMRHAQSEFNAQERFTGWIDCGLTAEGEAQARDAAHSLIAAGLGRFAWSFTSRLRRAANTASIVLAQLPDCARVELQSDWRLNERHLGQLQGRSRPELALEYSEEQVWRWRRGYEDRPPQLHADDPRHPRFDKTYEDIEPARLPTGENLNDTRQRLTEFYKEKVEPLLLKGERVLIVAHGFCLRSLLMELGQLSISEVEDFELPTATPIVCNPAFDGQKMQWRYL